MEVGIHANVSDLATYKVAGALRPVFAGLSSQLCGQYGGVMEHLWIDLELVARFTNARGIPRYPFRFQKRVSGRSQLGLPSVPDNFNVGHFSVRPDFALISTLPAEQAIRYALSIIYGALEVLLAKQKKLGNFDAVLFRQRFHEYCQSAGYPCAI